MPIAVTVTEEGWINQVLNQKFNDIKKQLHGRSLAECYQALIAFRDAASLLADAVAKEVPGLVANSDFADNTSAARPTEDASSSSARDLVDADIPFSIKNNYTLGKLVSIANAVKNDLLNSTIWVTINNRLQEKAILQLFPREVIERHDGGMSRHLSENMHDTVIAKIMHGETIEIVGKMTMGISVETMLIAAGAGHK
ncbi:uncharacterized protein ColSpa_02594 [Colletotrichum spaethianum]|uniref:Uncharacterized protein n=1 Tax=Colletotrichum spaethianum TaxID=700344 RepID=A0AA37NZP2_9PEZI|nr:uncharacterized protein ColSpa_02594 [Colletotrichum spaethianum]GKT42413.1 hypothetical protein ColSpa_02594 [Colletotrichum spaethianum]